MSSAAPAAALENEQGAPISDCARRRETLQFDSFNGATRHMGENEMERVFVTEAGFGGAVLESTIRPGFFADNADREFFGAVFCNVAMGTYYPGYGWTEDCGDEMYAIITSEFYQSKIDAQRRAIAIAECEARETNEFVAAGEAGLLWADYDRLINTQTMDYAVEAAIKQQMQDLAAGTYAGLEFDARNPDNWSEFTSNAGIYDQ